MSKSCIRVGLIGYGRSGRNIHSRTISRSGGRFIVAAISDVSENRREQASAEHTCPVYAEYTDMVEHEDIDLFIVSAISNFHIPISIELLRRNKAVLCEKPLTDSIRDFEELASTVAQTKSFFTVFQNLRFEPIYVKLREWLMSGMIGAPMQITMFTSQLARRWDWATLQSNKGGALLISGVHLLDLALQIAGPDYQPRVSASLKHRGVGDADNYAKVLLTSDDGPTIDIECSYFDAFPKPRYCVQGEYGTISCTERSIEARYYDPGEAPPVELTIEPLQNEDGDPVFCSDRLPLQVKTWEHNQNLYKVSFDNYYKRLYAALTGQADIPVTLDELRQQVRILELCFQHPIS